MKQFLNVLKFELSTYFKTKGYILSTVLISLVLIIGLSIPSFFDMSWLTGNNSDVVENTEQETSKDFELNFALVDSNNILTNDFLQNFFPNSKFLSANTEEELRNLVEDDKVEAGFIVNDLNNFEYFVKNSSLHDSNILIFEEVLTTLSKIEYSKANELDFEELEKAYNPNISSNINVLNKDGVNNYFYIYLLIFLLYFMILMYGQLIAVSVTSEKSNRSIEVLVTSVNPTSLIVGKVIAAAIAGFIQIGVILSSGIISYSINRDSWNGILDIIFDIPFEILLTFIIFGGTGYIFYSFIFGALGALVSKTEDISSSVGSITMIFVIVFFLALFGLNSPDSLIVKISSFIPFSSCMTMFVRMGVSTVSSFEIISSFVILLSSTILTAIIASKIYRLGTLRYGNPIKLKTAFKSLKNRD